MQEYIRPLKIVEIEKGNYHILVESELPDKSVGWWVIDTGASKSVFDSSLVGLYSEIDHETESELFSAGIGSGTVETSAGEISQVKWGDFKVKKFKVVLIKLDHINKHYHKYFIEKICGLIGSDFLKKYGAVIDYPEKVLHLRKR
jgi:hypothetical protein